MTAAGRLPSISEINVTPLVDVLLVLLIIFIVIAPLASHGLDASLPPNAPDTQPSPPPPLVVTIDTTGLSLNRQPVPSLEDLAARLTDAFAVRADRTLFVQAAGAVPYGSVVHVIDAAKGAGADRIGIVRR